MADQNTNNTTYIYFEKDDGFIGYPVTDGGGVKDLHKNEEFNQLSEEVHNNFFTKEESDERYLKAEDVGDIIDNGSLSNVAFSGSYNDLLDIPDKLVKLLELIDIT